VISAVVTSTSTDGRINMTGLTALSLLLLERVRLVDRNTIDRPDRLPTSFGLNDRYSVWSETDVGAPTPRKLRSEIRWILMTGAREAEEKAKGILATSPASPSSGPARVDLPVAAANR